jgi:hypothetical protein
MIQVAKEEALGMEKNRRQFSLQEEYWVSNYLQKQWIVPAQY